MEDKRSTTGKAGTRKRGAGVNQGCLSNKHRFLVHTTRALVELSLVSGVGTRASVPVESGLPSSQIRH